MSDLANKIRDLRIQKNVSQENLAEKIMVSRQTIAKWEKGTVAPNTANLLSLCEYFDVKPDYFFDEEIKDDESVKESEVAAASVVESETAVDKTEKLPKYQRSVVADWLFPVMIIIFVLIDVALGIVVVAFGCTYFPMVGKEDVVMTFPVDLNMFILALFFFLVALGITIFTIVKYVEYERSKRGK